MTDTEKIQELKKIIYDLIVLVDCAQTHPNTRMDNYPEYKKEAEELGHKAGNL